MVSKPEASTGFRLDPRRCPIDMLSIGQGGVGMVEWLVSKRTGSPFAQSKAGHWHFVVLTWVAGDYWR